MDETPNPNQNKLFNCDNSLQPLRISPENKEENDAHFSSGLKEPGASPGPESCWEWVVMLPVRVFGPDEHYSAAYIIRGFFFLIFVDTLFVAATLHALFPPQRGHGFLLNY